jgi:hypothetical protein
MTKASAEQTLCFCCERSEKEGARKRRKKEKLKEIKKNKHIVFECVACS